MSSALDVLEQYVGAPPEWQPELATQAAKALDRMPVKVDPLLRERIFDRFLDEHPDAVYKRALALKAEHRPALLEALARCTDPEAKLLLAAGPKGFDETAALLKVLASASNCPLVVTNLAKGKEGRSKAALAACAAVVAEGYPAETSVAWAGMFGALLLHGSAAQAKAALALDPPGHAVRWLQAISKKLPPARRDELRERIEGIAEADDPEEGTPRYRRLHAPAERAPAPARAPKKSGASGEALLAAVYAEPLDDAPRAIYADWLLEHGDPLGELIQLQLARASGKKGTLAKEKILVESGKDTFWPGHPTRLGGHSIRWEWTERGFPSVFQGDMTSPALQENPGWSTIRDLWCSTPDALARLKLPKMPGLRSLRSVGLGSFEAIAAAKLPIEMLELDLDALPPATLATSFERLKRLEAQWKGANAVDAAARIGAIGLTRNIAELWLRSADEDVSFALDTLAALPPNVQRLECGSWYQLVTASRAGKDVSLEIHAEESALDAFLEQLAALAPSRASSVHVILAAGGMYTKKTRPLAEKRAKAAVKKFKQGKVSSPTR